MRQNLDLYACVRPVRYFPGVMTPMADSSYVDMVIFRENTEDIYAGIEYAAGSQEVQKLIHFLQHDLGARGIRFPASSGIGIKPVSKEGSQRLIRKAIQYCVDNDRTSVTLVHKGNIMKYTEGAFRNWGYQLAKDEFGALEIGGGPWMSFLNPVTGHEIVVKDMIADNFLQQILLRPEEFDVIATLNLNGDYISDALAAQVGGIGIAPGGNIGARAGGVRSHARHRAGLRRQGPRQSRLADPLGRDDAALPALERGGGPRHEGRGQHHRGEGTDVRPGAHAQGHPQAEAANSRSFAGGGQAGTGGTGARRHAGRHPGLRRSGHPPHGRLSLLPLPRSGRGLG